MTLVDSTALEMAGPLTPASHLSVAPASLSRRMCNLMEEVSHIKKAGRNSFHNYDYTKEADVAEAMRKLYAKHGIAIYPSDELVEVKETTTKRGDSQLFVRVVRVYRLESADDRSDYRECRVEGHSFDQGDKAIYKAYTSAHKYFQKITFNLTFDDGSDAENDSSPAPLAERSAPPARSRPAPRAAAPQQPSLVDKSLGDYVLTTECSKKGQSLTQVITEDPKWWQTTLLNASKRKALTPEDLQAMLSYQRYLEPTPTTETAA